MAAIPGSIPYTGFIAPTDSTDTFPVTKPEWGLGGLRRVADLTERDAITSPRRELGMLVYVVADQTYYTLKTGLTNSDWEAISFGVSIPVLTSLPPNDATKAGDQFWLNNTLWTYSKTGQFGTIAEGTPWPVKGYKETVFTQAINFAQDALSHVIILDDVLAGTTQTWETNLVGPGQWGLKTQSVLSGSLFTGKTIVQSQVKKYYQGAELLLIENSEFNLSGPPWSEIVVKTVNLSGSSSYGGATANIDQTIIEGTLKLYPPTS